MRLEFEKQIKGELLELNLNKINHFSSCQKNNTFSNIGDPIANAFQLMDDL